MTEFQEGQRVRVREEGGDPRLHPDKTTLNGGPPSFYFAEFNSWPFLDKVMAIRPDWLEPG